MLKDAAGQVGVDTTIVVNWKANKSPPDLRYMPAVIGFLGYNPLPRAITLGQQLVRCRMTFGLTQKEAALQIGVDSGTLARWERNERKPMRAFAQAVDDFLDREGRQVRARGKAG